MTALALPQFSSAGRFCIRQKGQRMTTIPPQGQQQPTDGEPSPAVLGFLRALADVDRQQAQGDVADRPAPDLPAPPTFTILPAGQPYRPAPPTA